jgi:hypothetical protein
MICCKINIAVCNYVKYRLALLIEGMKTIVLCGANPCREVKFYVSTSKIHTSIQQRLLILKLWKALQAFESEMKPQACETSFLRLA